MKASLRRLAALSLIFASLGLSASEDASPQRMLGAWDCAYEAASDGMSFRSESRDVYIGNGQANSSGTMKVRMYPDMPEVTYSLAATGSWQLVDNVLISTMDEVRIVNLSHPQIDALFDLQEMIPQGISESQEIIELSETDLILRSAADGGLYNCKRAGRTI